MAHQNVRVGAGEKELEATVGSTSNLVVGLAIDGRDDRPFDGLLTASFDRQPLDESSTEMVWVATPLA